ncbi:MAG: TrbG/VirB9 family P-type conjugative transfer protein [Rickettsiaceae bacterium]|nr:TrbG/VirB9 family P-type conjugative transfer protein [Rickettsiaceae bacterium]
MITANISLKNLGKLVTILIIFAFSAAANSEKGKIPLSTDSRIKTYVYNSNEVYLLPLALNHQCIIEVAKNEKIQTISLGERYAWDMKIINNRLFIKAIEKNVKTNMVLITNKRMYYFDVISKDVNDDENLKEFGGDIVYRMNFVYPEQKSYD